jgi:PAS domain S-box-containing protein
MAKESVKWPFSVQSAASRIGRPRDPQATQQMSQIAQTAMQPNPTFPSMFAELADVHRALDNDELEPCFQPVVELHTGLLSGFEVLARWKHPQHGLVLPENFISLAEEDGLVGRLMQQIMRKAFRSTPVLPAPLMVAVNISPTQLHNSNLPGEIRKIAEEGGFPLERLGIEITESGLLGNLELARKIAYELKDMGCKLALDDFGTGYSSLRHLQALPFDVLKVDRSFVISMTDKRESRKIVAAIIGLGHSLDLITLAEGVETEQQAEMLLRLECQLGQGWLYGHPLTADQIPQMEETAHWTPSAGFWMRGGNWVVSSLEALPTQRLAQLQAIYDGAPVGLCFLDCNLRYVSINRRLADLDGNSVAAYLGKTVEEMIPKAFPFFEPYLRRALKGEAILEVEITVPSPKAGEADRTTLLSYQPAFDEAGEVIGVSLSAVDITGRKRTEEALRESEDHLRYMVELNPEIPWVMDSEGNNLDVSSRWTKITGLSKEKTRNLGWLEAVHPEDVESTMKALVEALHTGEAVDVEYRVKSIDNGWRWMRSRGSPRIGPSGQIVRWYGSVQDIHDRKLLEESLRKKPA